MNVHRSGSAIRKLFRDWLPSLLLFSLLLVARSTLADHYHVPTGSMEHLVQPGDHVLVNKAAYGLRIPFTKQVFALGDTPQRGEIVVFDSPEDGVRLIKRVVAVGGDQVAIRGGRVILNNSLLIEPGQENFERFGHRVAQLNLERGGGPDMASIIVPKGQLLVLGDFRGNSHDGRFFGTIPTQEVYGRAAAIVWRRNDGPRWQGM